jgi:phosphohistidine swiveling domain-containing protein
MLPLDACAGRADVGGKAETLSRMRAAKMRVPDGFVVLPDEAIAAEELAAALARIGGSRFAVRSSSALEDGARGSAAGVFESMIDVRADDVAAAIERVRASAGSAAVAAYFAARKIDAADARVAVLVQPMVEAPTFGVAHSAGEVFAIEERDAGVPEHGDVTARALPRDDAREPAAGLRALEALVGGRVDAEFARDGDTITWLQARPLAYADVAHDRDGWRLDRRGHWLRDAAHNPDPLSTAQASLVELVDGLGVGPQQHVIGGYLYVERVAAPATDVVTDVRRLFDDDVVPDCTRVLDRAQSDGSLRAAVDAFAHVYRRYVGDISPLLAQARRALDATLRALTGESLAEHAVLLGGVGGKTVARDQALWQLGRGERTLQSVLDELGDHASAWDVAVPTDREQPQRVMSMAAQLARGPSPMALRDAAIERAQSAEQALRARLPMSSQRKFELAMQHARDVLPIAEDDDLLFLRAQSIVRAALLREAERMQLEPRARIFDFTIDDVLAQRTTPSRPRVAPLPHPPDAFVDGKPQWRAPRARGVLRGHGTSGCARGRAVVVRALADAPAQLPPGAVLVVAAIVPSLTPLLPQALALVTDHGGALSHGATLAREYGVPAVLGTARATTSIGDGCDVYVDADNGRVLILDEV